MCLRFNVLGLCYWSLENSGTGHGIIRNIHSSHESQNTRISSVYLEFVSKWRRLLCYLMIELAVNCSVINVKVKVKNVTLSTSTS
jgi:hypothetical protein